VPILVPSVPLMRARSQPYPRVQAADPPFPPARHSKGFAKCGPTGCLRHYSHCSGDWRPPRRREAVFRSTVSWAYHLVVTLDKQRRHRQTKTTFEIDTPHHKIVQRVIAIRDIECHLQPGAAQLLMLAGRPGATEHGPEGRAQCRDRIGGHVTLRHRTTRYAALILLKAYSATPRL
jgi:hypothetical protein